MTDVVHDTPAERAHCCEICMAEATGLKERRVVIECGHRLFELDTVIPKQVSSEASG